MQDLERLLSDLRAEGQAAPGPGLEDRVWRRIASIRRSHMATMRQLQMNVAILLAALGMGLAVGSASAAQDHTDPESAAMSLTGMLAPSTLLVGR